MFDREAFRAEIRKHLGSKHPSAAFAVRASMRVLPLYVFTDKNSEAFSFWNAADRNQYLLLLFKGYSCAIEYALTGPDFAGYDFTNSIRRNIHSDTSSAAIHAIVQGVRIGITADDMFWHVDSNFRYHSNWAAADSAAEVAADLADNDAARQAMQQDLEMEASMHQWLEHALWFEVKPNDWEKLYQDFRQAVLSMDASFEVWLDWYDDRLQGRPIDVELLERWNHIPGEIEEQGVSAINAYLKNLSNKTAMVSLNHVRAIFLGHGEAGKTSLIRALHGEQVIKGDEAMTAGIEIREWLVPNTEILAHLWDFGGQVVFHSTHKFFLRSSCVYIIVINARASIDDSEQAEYWLDHVKAFGGSAPVLIVGNKADEARVNLQMRTLSQRYSNITGFYSISCTESKTSYSLQFDIFRQALAKELQAISAHQMLFTPAQGKVLHELQQYSRDHAFLSENDFNVMCDNHGISKEGAQNRAWLVDIFDKLGVMLHFNELKTFHSAYMLNPHWLTHAVYTLLNAGQAQLSESDIIQILKNTKIRDKYKQLLVYPAEKCHFIVTTMQRFKLCHPLLKSNNAQMIPVLLPDELPSLDSLSFANDPRLNNVLHLEFAFSSFLPRSLIGEFMVSRYEEIKGNLQSQRGAVFSSKSLNAEALVEADYHRRLIIIQIHGKDAKEYLTILYDAMLRVFGDLKLEYREWINLPITACLNAPTNIFAPEKADYKQLLACARAGQTTYISSSGLPYDLGKVLGILLSKKEQKKAEIKIYGDIIKGDKKVSSQKIKAGRDISSGDGSFNLESNINHSFTRLHESKADTAVKEMMKELLNEIKALNGRIPMQDLAHMTEDVEKLISESNREVPRKEWYQLSLKGIKEAALSLKEIGEPVLDVVTKLKALL
jgi:GTPase SAR1 family protein